MKNRGFIYLIAAALAYASMGVLVKFLSHELTPLTQTFYRLTIAGIFSTMYVIATKKPMVIQSKKDLPLLLFMGIFGYGLSIIAYTYAFNYASIATVLFVFSSYPIMTAFLAFFILKESIQRIHVIALAVLMIGLYLIFNPAQLFQNLHGNLISLTASATFAFYIICSRILTKRGYSPEIITMISIWIGAISSGVYVLFFEKLLFPTNIWIYVGIVFFAFLNFSGYLLINKGFQHVKASTGTMLLLLEPIVGAIMGYAFFREVPSLLFGCGAALIIFSIYLSTKTYKN